MIVRLLVRNLNPEDYDAMVSDMENEYGVDVECIETYDEQE